MKKLVPLLLIIFSPSLLNAQSYKKLTDSALKVYQSPRGDDAKAKTAYPAAYKLYQEAFSKYPKEGDWLSYYKAGYLAGELGDNTKAFAYLAKAADNGGFSVITGKYARGEFEKLINDERWDKLVTYAKAKEKAYLDAIYQRQQPLLSAANRFDKIDLEKYSAPTIYKQIKTYNQYPALKDHYVSMQIKLNETQHTAYLVVLPPNYNAQKKYPLLFFLHGAVNGNTGYLDFVNAENDTAGWNRYYSKYAPAHNVIMVYAHGNRDYNWMYPDKGFFMIPEILTQLKKSINIDDDKVFISGHSNGATGSFSYMMKEPSPFAGFIGFNTMPRVVTGGTFLRNALNRPFFNVSVDSDYYYPPAAHDSLTKIMKAMGADYQDHRYNGFPHWFPQFSQSEPVYPLLFASLDTHVRNPFKHNIYWECDDTQYGNCDWVSITSLDTTAQRAPWQQNINYPINKWVVLDKQGNAHERDTLLNAYKYKKRSGAVKGTFNNNIFDLQTSDIGSLSIKISPEMVDMSKPVTVMVNGKVKAKQKVDYDKRFMIDSFKNTADRKAVWVNHIDVKLE